MRATMVSMICGFIEDPNQISNSTTVQYFVYDLHQLEYYLHCYSMLMKHRASFIDSKEGYTYLTRKLEVNITEKILFYSPPRELQVFIKEALRATKRFKVDPI